MYGDLTGFGEVIYFGVAYLYQNWAKTKYIWYFHQCELFYKTNYCYTGECYTYDYNSTQLVIRSDCDDEKFKNSKIQKKNYFSIYSKSIFRTNLDIALRSSIYIHDTRWQFNSDGNEKKNEKEQMNKMLKFSPVWQVIPVYPGRHEHAYMFIPSTQVALCWQGLLIHSLISVFTKKIWMLI